MTGTDAPTARRTAWLLAIALALPLCFGAAWFLWSGPAAPPLHPCSVSHFPPASHPFDRQALGREAGFRPQITCVRVADLDGDGRLDVLASDGRLNQVFWQRNLGNGRWEEIALGDELNCPAGLVVVDLDGDGDQDVVVSVLGSVYPTDDRVGQVVLLRNDGGKFTNHVLLDHVRRVSDVSAGDLDGDGDVDLAVAVFGCHHGEILWLENRQEGRFRDHLLHAGQGPSHVPLVDLDGDGDLDIAALISQDHEEIWAFENQGKGAFQPRRLHHFTNFDLGGASLLAADLDRDGKMDLLLSAGDNLEVNHHYPQQWHGVYWLRNKGNWTVEARHLAAIGGVYAAAVADVDGDGDNDVVAACMFNDWRTPGSASLVLLTNDGQNQFTPTMLADRPIHLAVLAAGDVNGDGRPDLVAGCLFLDDPPDRSGRLTLWLNRKGGGP